ncbi:MAG: PilZ domain-containing protein [Desulfobacteraceae bacterium]|nr:PilZ domain-containing protein [Desulfobacteraceae bacterium]
MGYDTLFGERRLHERKSCALSITIDDYDRHYSGYLLNLSRGGALIEPSSYFKATIGQELTLTIPFATKKGVTMIKGKVTRKRGDGVVIAFLK